MPSKSAIFIAVLLTQALVFILYELDAVDKIAYTFNYSADKWKNSTVLYKMFVSLNSRRNASTSSRPSSRNSTGVLEGIHTFISQSKKSVMDLLKRKTPTSVTLPLLASDGDIHNRAFAPVITENVFLLVLITTHPNARTRRDVIRKTWAATAETKHRTGRAGKTLNTSPSYSNLNVYCIFSCGFANDAKLDKELEEESDKYGDILRVDQREQYRKLVDKIWNAFGWALNVKPKFILKADDDVYINMPKLINWLHEPKIPAKLYAGFVHYRAYINRSPGSKWFVSRKDFREQYFPNYCAGPFYIFSVNVLKDVYEASLKIQKFPVEDAYFGLLARTVKVVPHNVGGTLWAWEGSMHVRSKKWTDERLKKAAVLGDSLDDSAIQYLYDRYKKIKQNR